MSSAILNKYIRPEVLSQLTRFKLDPRQLVEGNLAGAHKSPFHGFAVEFASHREYVAGDDLRHLDWKVYFRHERHVIKQYEMETNLNCHLILDVSASMRYGEEDQQKLLYSSQIATTLAYLVVEQSDRVSLTTFDNKTRGYLPPSNNMGQIIRMTESLDQVKSINKTNIAKNVFINHPDMKLKLEDISVFIANWDSKVDNIKKKYMAHRPAGYVFNSDRQTGSRECIIVVEGVFDAIAIDGVGVLGSNINEQQADIIDSIGKEVIVVPDRDKAGEQLIDSALEYDWGVSFPNWHDDVKETVELPVVADNMSEEECEACTI